MYCAIGFAEFCDQAQSAIDGVDARVQLWAHAVSERNR